MVGFCLGGYGRVVFGDGGEVVDERAAAGGVPGQAHLIGREVAEVAVGDAGAGVEDRGRQRQHDDAVAGGHVLEFLLHGAEDGHAAAAAGPHFGGDVTPFGDRGGVLQEMLAGEVGDGDRVLAGQGVPGREDRDPRFGQQRPDLQAALVGGQPDVADVGPAVADDVGLVIPAGPQHVHGQLRMGGGQGADGLGHDQAGHEPDRERARAAGRAGGPPAQRIRGGEQRPGVGEQLPTGRGQLGGPLVPREQLDLQLGFQRPDLAGQHRLGDVQDLSGPAEVQLLRDRDEIAQLTQVDVSHGFLPSVIPPRYDRHPNRSWTAPTPAAHREDMNTATAPRKEEIVMSKELLIKGGHVVTVDPDLGDLPASDVLVADGLIIAVGPDLEPTTTAAEVIEAAGRLVIPGMVDTHRHVWQGAIGGYTPQITGAGYGPAVLTGISLKFSPEDVYAGTMWGALQALDAGITTIADWAHNDQSPAHADADLRGLRDSGIRGCFLYGGPGPATDDPNPPHPADARRMRDQYFASGTYGRLRMGMALRGPCFTSAERNAEDYAFARDLGLPISVHVGMAGTADAVTTLQRYSLLGADVNYVHGNMLTDREFDLIAETQGTMTITPSTDMLMQFGTFPATGPALSRGIVSGFGIDTICSAGNDLFSEMRLALAAERSRANAPTLASGKQVPTVDLHQRDMLRLATIDGARVWHLEDEIGTLTPGKQADIAVIDMRSPHLDGFGDPVAVMVLGAGPADVETVIVGGDVVKRDGKLAGDHVDHALELMHAAREHLRA